MIYLRESRSDGWQVRWRVSLSTQLPSSRILNVKSRPLPDIGQVVRIDPDGSQHIVDRSLGDWRVTAVATISDSVFLLSSSDSTNDGQRVRVIRGSGIVEFLGQIEI